MTCHASTAKFGPGTAMKHTGISERLCHLPRHRQVVHRRDHLKTKPANHVPTTATCETCHVASNFTSFAGTAMKHTGISTGCTTCHAVGASGTAFFGVTPLPQGSVTSRPMPTA